MIRPAEHLVFDGALVTGRVCALLNKLLTLDKLRAQVRGQDAELDQTLLAMRLAGVAYAESSGSGTNSAPQSELDTRSTQQLNNTYNTTAAAAVLNLTDRAVRKAITEKRLKATLFDGRYRISREALNEYQANRKKKL